MTGELWAQLVFCSRFLQTKYCQNLNSGYISHKHSFKLTFKCLFFFCAILCRPIVYRIILLIHQTFSFFSLELVAKFKLFSERRNEEKKSEKYEFQFSNFSNAVMPGDVCTPVCETVYETICKTVMRLCVRLYMHESLQNNLFQSNVKQPNFSQNLHF